MDCFVIWSRVDLVFKHLYCVHWDVSVYSSTEQNQYVLKLLYRHTVDWVVMAFKNSLTHSSGHFPDSHLTIIASSEHYNDTVNYHEESPIHVSNRILECTNIVGLWELERWLCFCVPCKHGCSPQTSTATIVQCCQHFQWTDDFLVPKQTIKLYYAINY